MGSQDISPVLTGPVLVIGTGLLGASIGLGLRAAGVPVYLQDISPTVEAVAEDIGAGTRWSSLGEAKRASCAPQLVLVAARRTWLVTCACRHSIHMRRTGITRGPPSLILLR